MDKMMSKNDPHGYLSHIFKNVSKSEEAHARVKVNGHSRSMPKREGKGGGSTGVKAPDGQPNPAMVSPHKMAPMNKEREPGVATEMSRKKSGDKNAATSVAKSGSAEAGKKGNTSSAMLGKLEDRTLKGLKGPKSKILKEGHNTSGVIPKAKPQPRVLSQIEKARQAGGMGGNTNPTKTLGGLGPRRDAPAGQLGNQRSGAGTSFVPTRGTKYRPAGAR